MSLTAKDWLGEENILGIDIWNNKYRSNGETFEEWLGRISNNNEQYKQLIIEKKFLPAGRILANRGLYKTGKKITYSNCYVSTPPEDNLESIFEVAKNIARTYSYGGGIGIDISKLRPNEAKVNNAAKKSSGAVSFMDLYSMVTGLISQSGRRGALMIAIDCNHPDIEEFIDIKKDLNRVTKANISIKITDEFLNAVKNDSDYKLEFIVNPTGEVINKNIKAKELFTKLAKNNWDMGEPAMLFWDNISKWNLVSNDKNFSYAGTNPCAEEPLPAGGSCLLGSINLSEFVVNNEFQFKEFENTIRSAVRYLNEVMIEGMNLHPLKEQQKSVDNWRQIGLGLMGLADMLIKLKLKYGDEKSIKLCDMIGFIMADTAIQESALIAKESGSYLMYSTSVLESSYYIVNTSNETKNLVKEYGLANSQILTCAPTGTLSTMLGISGGIEPIYDYSYNRKTESLHEKEKTYKVYTPIVDKYLKDNNLKSEQELPSYFTTAKLLDYKDRIKMQAVWQKHIDASISSTVNLHENATVEDIENIYMLAWENGLKGITVFRDKCKRIGILTTDENDNTKEVIKLQRGDIIQVSDDVIGKKRKLMTGCGSLHCSAWFDPVTGELLETFLSKGSSGGCLNSITGLSRMISIAARSGCNIYSIIDQLNSCGTCASYAVRTATKKDTSKGACCPIAVGNALLDMYKEVRDELGLDESEGTVVKIDNKLLCPECGEEIIPENGCMSCKSCGWSKCS